MSSNILRDASASLVVFLVALPLCMGIALASGVPPERGLVTGIIGGLVVGLISGAPLQVSGPAAGLAVMVYDLVTTHGLGALGPVLFIAGALQCLAGICRLGGWFRAISPAVVHGMLAGIGLLIVASQFHVLMDQKPYPNGVTNLIMIPAQALGLLPLDGTGGEAALAVGLITVVAMLAWERFRPASLRFAPGALIGVLAGTGLSAGLGLSVARIGVPENFWQALPLPNDAWFGGLVNPALLLTAIALAFVASAETLLSAAAVDRMQHRVRTQYNRELFAQGVGNALCGIIGALPMTGVIVRSSANVQAGARTRLSTILHGALLLLCVVMLPGVLRLVPTAALAGVLIVTGWRLVSLRHVRDLMLHHGWVPAAIWAVTVIGVVGFDLLTGVLAGVALSVVESVPAFRRFVFRIRRSETPSGIELRLLGTGSFVHLPQLLSAVESAPPDREVRIRTRGLRFMDHTFAHALHEWRHRSDPSRRIVVG